MKKEINFRLVKMSGICFLPLFLLSRILFAQFYPPYIATVFDSSATEGYYFFSPKYSKKVTHPPGGIRETQMILDKFGEVIYFHPWLNQRASDFKIQPNGIMTYIDNDEFFLMDSTFTVIDSVHTKGGVTYDGHDFQILPNGHFLYLGAEKIQMDLSSYHMFNNNGDPGSANATVRCAVIQEQNINKNVVFEWHAKDHFVFEDTDSTFLDDTSTVDWNHCNAVELDYDGNILLSTRRFNEITKINRSDSSVMWRLGGKKNQFTFTNDTILFKAQHDIRRIANGNITLFDNGYRDPFHPCMVKEYMLDETQLIATLVWSYTYDSTKISSWLGNAQRLSNGNTIIDYGSLDSSNLIFNCVDSLGMSVFEVRSPDTLNSYRAFSYPDFPWNINRPIITCEEIGGQVYLSVDSGLSIYLWNTGDTTFKIAITNPDTFYVFVPRGNGGFLKSEKFIVSSLTNPCNLSNTTGISNLDFSLAPNPVTDNLYFKSDVLKNQPVLIEIFDVLGMLIYRVTGENENEVIIPVSSLSSGIYFIRANGVGKKFVKI